MKALDLFYENVLSTKQQRLSEFNQKFANLSCFLVQHQTFSPSHATPVSPQQLTWKVIFMSAELATWDESTKAKARPKKISSDTQSLREDLLCLTRRWTKNSKKKSLMFVILHNIYYFSCSSSESSRWTPNRWKWG